MINNQPNLKIEDYPLDSLILYSLNELSNGNSLAADKLHKTFLLKVKEALKAAQIFSRKGEDYKADCILTNITKAKIAQSEWVYLATQKHSTDENIRTKNKTNLVLLNDIYKDLKQSKEKFKKIQFLKLEKSFLNRDFDQTSNRAKQLLVIFPYDIDFQKFYGISQIKIGKYINAVKTFENALKFNKDNSELLFGMGEAKFKSGINSHAELFIRKGLLQDKENFYGNRILGEILINQRNFIEAEYYFKKAYKKNKNSASVNANLSLCLLKQEKYKKSSFFAKQSCNLAPENYKYLNNYGLILKAMNSFSEAKKTFVRALEISPAYADAHNNLGTLLQKHDPEKALYHYNRACLDKNILPVVYLNIATVLRQIGHGKLALEYAKQSIKHKSESFECTKVLGILFMDQGNFKKAEEFFKKTLKLNPLEAESYRLLSKISPFQDSIIQKLLIYLKEKKFKKIEEKHILFLLGDYYQKQKKYCLSWDYYNKANKAISNQIIEFNINDHKNRFNVIKKIFKEIYKNNYDLESDKRKLFFIVGLPRSGTTLVEQILSNNDDVFGAGEINLIPQSIDKILNRKNFDIKKTDQYELLNNIRNLYLEHINKKTRKNYIIDKMPYNFENIGIIKLLFPNSKFIHVYRNPVDNCFSLYKTYFSDNSHKFSYNLDSIFAYFNLYIKYILFWESFFSETIYNLNYDNLVLDQNFQIKKLISFCELKWNDRYLEPQENTRPVYTASAIQIRKKINKHSLNVGKNFNIYMTKFNQKFKNLNL